jgi:hypothetical protein
MAVRTDLQNTASIAAKKLAPKTPTGMTYGESQKLMDEQKAVPMGASPVEMTARETSRSKPAMYGPLTGPSARPNEPITTGVDVGAGLGTVASGLPTTFDARAAAISEIRAIAQLYPTEEILDLLDKYEYLA